VTLYKECAAEDFIVNDKPGEMLGMHHQFILDGEVRATRRRLSPLFFSLER